ncbi:MAG: DUF4244 domain-containing protein [Propionibacteriaceae bacterium]|jgi:hypothetical protein|nr:DUF4244 domain-containing protein [Propionibacteriaceae bacterium]
MKRLILSSRPARFLAALARRGEKGMATAEYAIGILLVVVIGGVLFKVISDGGFRDLIFELIKFLIGNIMKLF